LRLLSGGGERSRGGGGVFFEVSVPDGRHKRHLTIFGRAMLIKTLGISLLIRSASNLVAPKEIVEIVRTKSFNFLWKNKKDKIKRSGLYQDLDHDGIRMINFDIMLKALKLAWIPRLLRTSDNSNWFIIPKHYFRRKGGLNFLLRCNCDTNYFNDLPLLYKTTSTN